MGLKRLFLDIMGKPSYGSRHHRQNIEYGYFGKAGIAAKESLAKFEFDQWNLAFYLSSPFWLQALLGLFLELRKIFKSEGNP